MCSARQVKERDDMQTKTYSVTLTGLSDLLMHKDNLDFSKKLKTWQKDPANKKTSVAGDDRTPAWAWIGYLYHDTTTGLVGIDADNIMSMLRDGGKKCPAPTGKGSMKAQTQSGILCNEINWPLTVGWKHINYDAIKPLLHEQDFDAHMAATEALGFELLVKRARVGTSKHVRVRPRFRNWSATGTVTVFDAQISADMLRTLLAFAGRYAGIGDWRPGSPTPGQFGMFSSEVDLIG